MCATRSSSPSAWPTVGSGCRKAATPNTATASGSCTTRRGKRAVGRDQLGAPSADADAGRRWPRSDEPARPRVRGAARRRRAAARAGHVAAISARHRTEMFDETFGIVVDWGLGLAVDTSTMGRHCSRRDVRSRRPSVVGRVLRPRARRRGRGVCNGMPGSRPPLRAPRRDRSAVYVDLGLAAPTDAGRPSSTRPGAFERACRPASTDERVAVHDRARRSACVNDDLDVDCVVEIRGPDEHDRVGVDVAAPSACGRRRRRPPRRRRAAGACR